MKKRITYLALITGILLLAVGCNSKKEEDDLVVTPTPAATEEAEVTKAPDATEEYEAPEYLTNELVKEDYNVDEYIKLGEYKGIEVTVESTDVKEEDVKVAIQSDLEYGGATLSEVTGRAVQMGDTVNIDYEGIKDGVAFEGGTGTGFDLMIGSGQFIPGFEDQLIGTKEGDKVELDISFPESYPSEDLAGKPVIFKVTVNKIQEYTLTEDYLKENTDFDNVDDYVASIRENLVLEKAENRKYEIENNVYNKILENSTIISLPQTLIDYYKNDLKIYYSNYALTYGMDFAGFLSASGVTEEIFDEDALEYAESMAKRDLVYKAIIKAENIELPEDEFNSAVEALAAEYGYESADALKETADEVLLREDVLYRKVLESLVAEAVIKG